MLTRQNKETKKQTKFRNQNQSSMNVYVCIYYYEESLQNVSSFFMEGTMKMLFELKHY